MSVLGFVIKKSSNGGDFIPIIKYDARSGRIFRVDRVQDDGGNFFSDNIDITQTFRAVVDFDNIETGWMQFTPGQAPSFTMVKIASISPQNPLPAQPTANHKEGVRFLLKLHPKCAGDKSIREIAGTAKSFLTAIESTYTDFLRDRANYPNKLPILICDGSTPVKSGSGSQVSTNYQPLLRIDGWADRPVDLGSVAEAPRAPSEPLPAPRLVLSPSTGSTPVAAPKRMGGRPVPQVAVDDNDDFG